MSFLKQCNIKQKKQLLEIYNDHMLRMLMAYFQTDDGKLLEVSSKNEADLLINTCELMALSFIPNNHDCSVIPINFHPSMV